MTHFLIAIFLVLSLPVIVMIHHRRQNGSSLRKRRYRCVCDIYAASSRERKRTRIIDHDRHLIVGDGAWVTTRAVYPKGV